MLLNVDANLTVNEKPLEVYALGMSPSGKAKGPLVHIPNLGCDKVRLESILQENRGTNLELV